MTGQQSPSHTQPAEAESPSGRRPWHSPQMIDLTIAIETRASSGTPTDGGAWQSATA